MVAWSASVALWAFRQGEDSGSAVLCGSSGHVVRGTHRAVGEQHGERGGVALDTKLDPEHLWRAAAASTTASTLSSL
jgi:hypothetical protein